MAMFKNGDVVRLNAKGRRIMSECAEALPDPLGAIVARLPGSYYGIVTATLESGFAETPIPGDWLELTDKPVDWGAGTTMADMHARLWAMRAERNDLRAQLAKLRRKMKVALDALK